MERNEFFQFLIKLNTELAWYLSSVHTSMQKIFPETISKKVPKQKYYDNLENCHLKFQKNLQL